jgi:hypothetical protein
MKRKEEEPNITYFHYFVLEKGREMKLMKKEGR